MPHKVAIDEHDFPWPTFKLLAKGNLINKGPNGKVFEAKTPKGNRGAIKEIILAHVSEDVQATRDRFIEDFMERIDELRELEHENLVDIYGSHRITGNLQIFMSLGKPHLDCSVALPEEKVKVITKQIVQALAFLHEQGIPHGGLKPENIHVRTTDLSVKLSDFGTHKLIRDIANPSDGFQSISVTPHYVDPEILMGRDYDDIPADIWGLGCCVVQMLSGNKPWSHLKNEGAIVMHVMKTQELPCVIDGASDDAKDFVKMCFERKQSLRADILTLSNHPWLA
mmetsp:Transcript_25465/g.46012  ORF Transcript_25465/g.46012 Transcript_25465/m.46012 type:complete len:282 (-) Transcript_25465:87-932(-)